MDDRNEFGPEPRIERETTVITTGERSGGDVLAAIVLVALAVVVLFFVAGERFTGAAERDLNVDVTVESPEIRLPDVEIPEVRLPEGDTAAEPAPEPAE